MMRLAALADEMLVGLESPELAAVRRRRAELLFWRSRWPRLRMRLTPLPASLLKKHHLRDARDLDALVKLQRTLDALYA